MDHGGDHGDHGGGDHGDHGDMDMKCPMTMHFHAGHCELILWEGWTASSEVAFVFSALGIFVAAFLYEGLKYVRERYYVSVSQAEQLKAIANRTAESNGTVCCNSSLQLEQKSVYHRMFNRDHGIQTLLHFIQIIISYLLMLIVMTYNYWLFAAVVLGASAGYFCFGWIRQQASDASEHCH